MKTLLALTFSIGFAAGLSAQTLSNYQSVVSSQSPSAYFKLDGTLVNSVTPSQSLTAGGGYFGSDAVHHLTNAYVFNLATDSLSLSTDIVPGGDPIGTNSAAAGKGSISALFRALDSSSTGQRFIFSQGAGATTNGNALGLFFENNTSTNSPGDLKLRVGNSTVSILASNLIAFDQWYYFAMTYDESRDSGEVIWYLGRSGGTLNSGTLDISNDAVVGDNGSLVIGNQLDLSSGYRNPGNGRIDEFAVWTRELSSSEVGSQFAQLPNYFSANVSYQTLISSQFPAHYFKLDGSLADAVAPSTAVGTNGTAGAFSTNVLGVANSAYTFNETNDAIIITNDIINGGGPAANSLANASGTISFLFRMLGDVTNTGQRWLISQGTNTSARDALNVFLENTNVNNTDPNSLKLRLGNTTTTLIQANNLVPNAWYYLALAYDENRDSQTGGEVRWFVGPVGGVLTNGVFNPANDAVVGDNGLVYLGNRTTYTFGFRNPGSGSMDEFATWNDELSPDEITAQFNAVTAQPQIAAPNLSIIIDGSNAVLSWPGSTPSAYALEATPSLIAPITWTNAGSATLNGGNYYVTNALAPSAQFFRLHKP